MFIRQSECPKQQCDNAEHPEEQNVLSKLGRGGFDCLAAAAKHLETSSLSGEVNTHTHTMNAASFRPHNKKFYEVF